MIRDKKLVVVTPCGRRRYLEVLARYVLNDMDVDRWDLWENTNDRGDLEYVHSLANHPKVRLVTTPEPLTDPLSFRIYRFFKQATDANTIYVRLDDDIVWYDKYAVVYLANMRYMYPRPFLVYGNVVNSGLTTHIQQGRGTIPMEWGITKYECMDDVAWKDPEFAVKLHRLFLKDAMHGESSKWHLLNFFLTDYERHSINVISWDGKDAAKWVPDMDYDEEFWLSITAPKQHERPNMVIGDAMFSHFSFYTQREAMDQSGLLDEYRKLAGL